MDSENKCESMGALKCRDERLEHLWARFHDVPIDPDAERIDEPFLHWVPGVHREDIWAWFDQRYSKGIVGLLYPGTDAREAELLYKIKQSCTE